MLETVEHIGAEALVVILVLLVGDVLDKHAGIEVDQRAGQTTASVLSQVDGRKRSVRTVALADCRHALPTTGVGIEVVGLLARSLVFHFHQIGGKHRIPLAVNVMREDRAFVAPLGEILDGSRPHADVAAAIGRIVGVVRADDVGAQLTWVVGVFEYAGFAIGQMLPEREIRVLSVG